jgi:DNA gyrase subunit B/topoisomerase-4 subunit B
MNVPHGPLKLDDCTVHGSGSGAELFVVEGDSASSAVARVRDPAFQAVLPMQGKPLNARRAVPGRVAAHPLYAALVGALGTGIGDRCDAAVVRYDRVLLLMDPDADGIHCGVLMLMFFHRWLRPLLEGGHVEVVRPPWGEIIMAGERSPRLAFSEPEFQSLADHLRGQGGIPGRSAGVARRYRGLAGIDAGILHATCVAPASRRTSRMTGGDVERMIALLDEIGSPDGPDA